MPCPGAKNEAKAKILHLFTSTRKGICGLQVCKIKQTTNNIIHPTIIFTLKGAIFRLGLRH